MRREIGDDATHSRRMSYAILSTGDLRAEREQGWRMVEELI